MFLIRTVVLTVLAVVTGEGTQSACDVFPSFKEIASCCRLPILIPEDVWQGCLWSPLNPNAATDPDKHCAADCLFRKLKFVGDDNEMNYASAESWLIGNIEQHGSAMQQAMERTIAHCSDLVVNAEINYQTYPCQSKADFFMTCLKEKIPLNCPDDRWIDNEKCVVIKQVINSCPHPAIEPASFP